VLCVLLAGWQVRLKTRRDQALMQGDQAKAAELAIQGQRKLRYWSAPILVCYALLFSLLSFDLMMSLAPKWYSTLWGGWTFACMMQSTLAALLFFMYLMKRSPVGQHIRRQQFHDVGKLLHGFTAFFGYITYAHIITYWYGNIPEETEFYLHRLKGPWLGIMIAVAFMAFVFPLYSLLPKASKWTAGLSLPICFSILFAQWLTSLLVVIPQTVADNAWSLPWIEVGTFLGFLGLFLSSVTWFGRRNPMLAVADPLLADALGDGH
jgi:hypothetical protein